MDKKLEKLIYWRAVKVIDGKGESVKKRQKLNKKFSKKAGVNPVDNADLFLQYMQQAIAQKNNYHLDLLIGLFGAFEACHLVSKLIAPLLVESWHCKHEEIAVILKSVNDESAVDFLFAGATYRCDNLDYQSDYCSFACKCIHALSRINTPKALSKLQSLLAYENKIVADCALRRLESARVQDVVCRLDRPADIRVELKNTRQSKNLFRNGYTPNFNFDGELVGGVIRFVDCYWLEYGNQALADIWFLTPESYANCLSVGKILAVQEGSVVHGSAKIVCINNEVLKERTHFTNLQYVLDSLIDDDEAFAQISEYFKFVKVKISDDELKTLLSQMVEDGYICINNGWVNEKNEYPYSLTEKGKECWEKIEF